MSVSYYLEILLLLFLISLIILKFQYSFKYKNFKIIFDGNASAIQSKTNSISSAESNASKNSQLRKNKE